MAALGPGTRVAFDYLSLALIERRGPLRFRYVTPILNVTGEPLLFGIPVEGDARGHLAGFLEEHGLRLDHYEPYAEGRAQFGGVAVASPVGAPAG